MKNKSIIILVVVAMAICCVLTACNGQSIDSYAKDIQTSMNTVASARYTYTMVDGETTIYRYVKNTSVNGEDADVEVIESTLNDYFVLEDKSTYTTEALDRSKLCTLKLDKSLLLGFETSGNSLVCDIAADKISSVLGMEIETDNNVVLTAEFQNKKLISVNCDIVTKSDKKISIAMEYSYEG